MRTQGNYDRGEASKASQIDCSHPIKVRPEFGPETDVKTILRRHNVGPLTTRQADYTETDFDKDLTVALADLKRAHDAFEQLPMKHRTRFKSADELWRHYRAGNLAQDAAAEALAEKAAVDSQAAGST